MLRLPLRESADSQIAPFRATISRISEPTFSTMDSTTYQTIRVKREGSALFIELHKPPLNILDIAMMDEIYDALSAVESDSGTRVVVFRGAGEKAFCAGVSIQDHLPDRIREMIQHFHRIFRLLAKTDKITIAAVHGHCLGGGLELAIMCDLVVASEEAQFGQPEIKLGQLPPVGIILLPHLIGYRKAAELLFTGASIGASEARTLGLVNRVVPKTELHNATGELIQEMTTHSATALRLTKQLLRKVAGLDFERALKESEELFLGALVGTEDAKEGIVAFLEKRKPQWTHQ